MSHFCSPNLVNVNIVLRFFWAHPNKSFFHKYVHICRSRPVSHFCSPNLVNVNIVLRFFWAHPNKSFFHKYVHICRSRPVSHFCSPNLVNVNIVLRFFWAHPNKVFFSQIRPYLSQPTSVAFLFSKSRKCQHSSTLLLGPPE